MEELNIKSEAKINLSLDILGKLENGYHEISTIMHTVELSDNIFIKKVYKKDYLKLITNIGWLPVDEKNLIFKAAKYVKEKFAIEEGIFLNLTKVIPVSAGLGGGSANCAATLKGIKKLFDLPLSLDELADLGAKFGADVPFCVHTGAALATGVGEIIKPLPKMPTSHIVIVKPPVIVSTEDIFGAYNDDKVKHRPDTEKLIYSLEKGDLIGICDSMENVLETVTAKKHPVINKLKTCLKEQGALGAMMSGSGPSVFGIFEDYKTAESALNAIKDKHPTYKEIFLTKSTS